MSEQGLALDEAQEARNNARKHWHMIAIYWIALKDRMPASEDAEVRLQLMTTWYQNTLNAITSQSIAEGMAQAMFGVGEAEDDEDDEE